MNAILHVLGWVIILYLWLVMFPVAILSWFRLQPGTPLARVRFLLNQATEPVLRPVRRIIPPMGGLDLSFFVVFLGAQIIVYRVLWS